MGKLKSIRHLLPFRHLLAILAYTNSLTFSLLTPYCGITLSNKYCEYIFNTNSIGF